MVPLRYGCLIRGSRGAVDECTYNYGTVSTQNLQQNVDKYICHNEGFLLAIDHVVAHSEILTTAEPGKKLLRASDVCQCSQRQSALWNVQSEPELAHEFSVNHVIHNVSRWT